MSAREQWSWGPVLSELRAGRLSPPPEPGTPTRPLAPEESSIAPVRDRGIWFRRPPAEHPAPSPAPVQEIPGRGVWFHRTLPSEVVTRPRIIELSASSAPAPGTARRRHETEMQLLRELATTEPWEPWSAPVKGVSA